MCEPGKQNPQLPLQNVHDYVKYEKQSQYIHVKWKDLDKLQTPVAWDYSWFN